MKAEVAGNAIELSLSPSEAMLLGISVLLVAVLMLVAGWEIALVALGLSLLGAGAVAVVQ